jgi:molybdate transport system substrate-binding protein
MRIFRFIAAVLLLVLPALAGEITVAAAADLSAPIQEIAAGFEKQTGNKARLSLGSSGNLFAQIESGAPFDVFLSADAEYPKKLEADGFAVPGSVRTYAIGKLVLWVPAASPLDLSKGMDVLLDPAVHRIAIANPRHAPYGRAAVEAMQHAGVSDRVKDKLVLGENVSQAAQFVDSGNAEVGMVAKALVAGGAMKDKGRPADVPTQLYSPLIQAAAIVKTTRDAALAKSFLDYLTGPAGRDVLERYGFALPEWKK